MLMEPAAGGAERTSRRPVSVHPCWARKRFSMNSPQVFDQTLMGPTPASSVYAGVTAEDLKDLGVTSCPPSQRRLRSYNRAGTLCERLEKHPRQSPHRPKTRLPSPAKSPHGLRRHPRGISLPELRGGDLAERRRLRRVMGVLVHFGYYQAHEDDPEKAVRDRAQAGHCSKQSKEPRSCRHAWQATGLLLKFD